MSSSRRSRRLLRVLLYALALGTGAGLAHVTRDGGTSESATRAAEIAHALAPLGPERVSAASTPYAPPAPPSPQPPRPAPVPEPARRASTDYADGLTIAGGSPHRLILFSFDDGPDRRTTPLLLDRLDAVGVKAVFFLTASRMAGRTPIEREQAALAREILARGHLVGSHTVDHLQLPLLDDAQANAQVLGAEVIFERMLGFRPTLFRPPGGALSPRIDQLLANRGYTTVLWNVGTGDFQVHSAPQVYDTFIKVLERREREHGERGGILLLHDTYAWSVDAFQMIYAELSARNCRLWRSGDELYDIVSDLSFFYQPRAGAASSVLAAPATPPADVLAARQARLRLEASQRCNSTDGL